MPLLALGEINTMVQYHKSPKTKASGTGGKRRSLRDKILLHYGGFPARSKVARENEEESRVNKRTKGGASKTSAKTVQFALVSEGATSKKSKIITVLESPDNRHYSRENIITKGAMINTELGKCRVTSRPGQSGVVACVLVEKAVAKAEAKPAAKAEAKPEGKAKPVAAKA